MKEILFKAKRKNWRELPEDEWWVEGDILKSDEEYSIVPSAGVCCVEEYKSASTNKFIQLYAYEVDPKTVCQYTGLTDKNEKKIFEGDIVSGKRYRDYGQSGEFVDDKKVVKWNDKKCGFDPIRWFDGYSHDIKHYEVIGNIFDNPDLLTTSSTDSD